MLQDALGQADVVLLSGGTSKGAGDLSYRAVSELSEPGTVAHGVALKPGKPICLAAHQGKPVVILPGFPTSAIFTFHEFVAPLLRRLTGTAERERGVVPATVPLRITSATGRTEYSLVEVAEGPAGLAAYPIGAGSGSVTAFGRADGFVRIPASTEYVEAGSVVDVHLLKPSLRPADLVAIGSHCIGLDYLLGLLTDAGFRVKMVPVGSMGGLAAVGRGEADVAGIHVMDAGTGEVKWKHETGDEITWGDQIVVQTQGQPRRAASCRRGKENQDRPGPAGAH